MSVYLGDFLGTETIQHKFTTVQSTGAPTTLAGTPKLRCYKGSSTTESSDLTPTVDLDARTGLNLVSIDLTGDSSFYATGNDYSIVITAGTVNSVSVVGYVVGCFSVLNRPYLRPTTAGRTLDVSAGGEAGLDWANVGSPTTALALTGTTIATTQKVDLETIKTQAVTCAGGVTVPAATLASTTNITAGTITTATTATNLTNAPTAGDFTATMKTSIGTAVAASAVASVTGAVASVTGNVGGNVTGSIGSLAAQAQSDVKTQAVAVFATDTYAEPGQGAPAATTTLSAKLNYLYKWMRNKKDNDGTTTKFYADDAATVDQKAATSSAAGVVTVGEIATGP